MPVYPQQNNIHQENLSPIDSDLAHEKQLAAKITEELKKELIGKWQKRYAGAEIFPPILSDVNPALIDFLLSFQHTLFYNEIGQKFKLNQEQRNALPAVVWNICKSKHWETTVNLLQTDLNLSPQIASQIASLVNQKIIFKAKELASQSFTPNANKKNLAGEIDSKISIPLSEALRVYPEVGEQLVTSSKINLRSFPYPVRPSLKNWVADYTSILGYEKHAAMDRSNYLFQSANTKNLSDPERQKLAYLLKSFDENSPITLNKNTKQIIWPTITPANKPSVENRLPENLSAQFRPTAAPETEQKNINSMEFSYRQKMPYEKTLAAPAPVKSLPEHDSWKLPAEKTFTPHTPAKNPPLNTPIKSNPWRLPGKSVPPPSPPKNVIDLKNIQE